MNNELPQTLPSFDTTCYFDKENSVPCVSKPNFVDESSNIFNPPPQPPICYCEFCRSNAQYGHYCTPQAPFINSEPGYSQDFNFPQNIHDFQQQYLCCDQCGGPHETFQCQQELAEYINTPGWNRPAFYDDDDDVDYTIAITPVLSTEEPIDSLSIGDEHLDTISATGSDEVIKSSVENLVPILNDNLHEKLLNVHLLIANIDALKDNPTPSSKLLTKSSSTSPKSFLEETNTFYNSLPEFENFCFDLEKISSGITTTHSDISLPDYEAFSFNNDHIKEIGSGSTTTHSDVSFSEYDSFTFDISNDQFPPTDRSDFANEEFAYELAHIISPPEYDCFYFWKLSDLGELILNSGIYENLSSTTRMNLPV
nr:hypothetical protein [Tanacetum cinerariifolium]